MLPPLRRWANRPCALHSLLSGLKLRDGRLFHFLKLAAKSACCLRIDAVLVNTLFFLVLAATGQFLIKNLFIFRCFVPLGTFDFFRFLVISSRKSHTNSAY